MESTEAIERARTVTVLRHTLTQYRTSQSNRIGRYRMSAQRRRHGIAAAFRGAGVSGRERVRVPRLSSEEREGSKHCLRMYLTHLLLCPKCTVSVPSRYYLGTTVPHHLSPMSSTSSNVPCWYWMAPVLEYRTHRIANQTLRRRRVGAYGDVPGGVLWRRLLVAAYARSVLDTVWGHGAREHASTWART
eukprot:137713-Rhodomonas_salina.2